MMHRSTVLAALCAVVLGSVPASAQTAGCSSPLATVNAAEGSYSSVNIREFEGRVFLYVPDISSSRSAFEPFELWVVEGIYGRPFVQAAGTIEKSAFDRLRKSTNIRATPVSIRRVNESTRATIARQPYLLDVAVKPAPNGDSLTVRICRGR